MGMGITLNLTFSFRLLLNQRIFQYFKQFNISIIITMSSQNDPLAAAKQAERDLNSNAAKQGYSKGDSATDSGIDDRATKKFPGASVTLVALPQAQAITARFPSRKAVVLGNMDSLLRREILRGRVDRRIRRRRLGGIEGVRMGFEVLC